MFKLVTGSPGDGKTSNELWEFLNAPQYKGRPKYCTPINGFEPEKHGVTPIEHISVWQDLPDGSVIFCDEIQDYCGTNLGKDAPEWVQQLARHRHRGFDFIGTTQSPMFLHAFARKLAKPHVHYIRPWNMKGVQYTWDTVQNDPNAKSSKATGTRKAVTANPEVFKLYTSTVLDTHKARPPWKVIISLSLLLLVVLGGLGFGVYRVAGFNTAANERAHTVEYVDEVPGKTQPVGQSPGVIPSVPAPVHEARWSQDKLTPTIPGLGYTAPMFDELTAPSDFPRVAACMESKERQTCDCYTQQATPISVPPDACRVFVRHSSFDPWLTARRANQQQGQQVRTEPVQPVEQAPQKVRSTGAVVNVVEQPRREEVAKR